MSRGGWPLLAAMAAATPPRECAPQRRAELARAVRVAWECDWLPLGGTPGSFKGVNQEIGARAPKRSWQNGTVSNSIARQASDCSSLH